MDDEDLFRLSPLFKAPSAPKRPIAKKNDVVKKNLSGSGSGQPFSSDALINPFADVCPMCGRDMNVLTTTERSKHMECCNGSSCPPKKTAKPSAKAESKKNSRVTKRVVSSMGPSRESSRVPSELDDLDSDLRVTTASVRIESPHFTRIPDPGEARRRRPRSYSIVELKPRGCRCDVLDTCRERFLSVFKVKKVQSQKEEGFESVQQRRAHRTATFSAHYSDMFSKLCRLSQLSSDLSRLPSLPPSASAPFQLLTTDGLVDANRPILAVRSRIFPQRIPSAIEKIEIDADMETTLHWLTFVYSARVEWPNRLTPSIQAVATRFGPTGLDLICAAMQEERGRMRDPLLDVAGEKENAVVEQEQEKEKEQSIDHSSLLGERVAMRQEMVEEQMETEHEEKEEKEQPPEQETVAEATMDVSSLLGWANSRTRVQQMLEDSKEPLSVSSLGRTEETVEQQEQLVEQQEEELEQSSLFAGINMADETIAKDVDSDVESIPAPVERASSPDSDICILDVVPTTHRLSQQPSPEIEDVTPTKRRRSKTATPPTHAPPPSSQSERQDSSPDLFDDDDDFNLAICEERHTQSNQLDMTPTRPPSVSAAHALTFTSVYSEASAHKGSPSVAPVDMTGEAQEEERGVDEDIDTSSDVHGAMYDFDYPPEAEGMNATLCGYSPKRTVDVSMGSFPATPTVQVEKKVVDKDSFFDSPSEYMPAGGAGGGEGGEDGMRTPPQPRRSPRGSTMSALNRIRSEAGLPILGDVPPNASSTPIQPARKKARFGSNVKVLKTTNVTPLPDYDKMDDARLKVELAVYGLKPMGRKRAIDMLRKIYDGRHPIVDHSVAQQHKPPEPVKRGKKKDAPPPQAPPPAEEEGESDGDMDRTLNESFDEGNAPLEETVLDELDPTELPKDMAGIRRTFLAWLRRPENSTLYNHMLSLQSVALEELYVRVGKADDAISGISKKALMTVLDHLHITYSLPNDGWSRKRGSK